MGMGPAGELRYPSYPERDRRWQFPGIGEFQCYDKVVTSFTVQFFRNSFKLSLFFPYLFQYMLAQLKSHAESMEKPLWGLCGPHDSGTYKQLPDETGFFHINGSWKSPYGDFFLQVPLKASPLLKKI